MNSTSKPPVPESPVLSERKKMPPLEPKKEKSAFWPSYENNCREAIPFTPCTITFLYTDPFMKTQLFKLLQESLKTSPKRTLPK